MVNVEDGVASLIGSLERLQRCLITLNDTDIGSAQFRVATHETLIRSEALTESVRNFVSRVLSPPELEVATAILDKHKDITITAHDIGAICIGFPGLLPHRKHRDRGFITVPLARALKKYVSEHPNFDRKTKAEVCIVHTYGRNRVHFARDHDNIEMKAVMDTIATYLLAGDSCWHINLHHYGDVGDSDYTSIYIVPPNRFLDWHLRQVNCL